MLQELRIYEIFEHNREAFHARFRDQAMPRMRRLGFRFDGLWESRNDGRLEFYYLLSWPDEATRKRAWEALLNDPDWKRVKQDTAAKHGELVGGTQTRLLTPTDYGAD